MIRARHPSRARWKQLLVLVACLSLAIPTTGRAHSALNYYSTSWGPDDAPNIDWRFTAQVPGGNFRDRVENGTVQWNNVSDANFNWVKQTPEYSNFNPNPSNCHDIPDDKNGVHYRSLPSGAAVMYGCSENGFLANTQVVFNSNLTWYAGTGDTPAGETDVWSFAAHEFGCATGGWLPGSVGGHFGGSTLCPSNSSRHTMCASLANGQNWWRSLEFHDGETFANSY